MAAAAAAKTADSFILKKLTLQKLKVASSSSSSSSSACFWPWKVSPTDRSKKTKFNCFCFCLNPHHHHHLRHRQRLKRWCRRHHLSRRLVRSIVSRKFLWIKNNLFFGGGCMACNGCCWRHSTQVQSQLSLDIFNVCRNDKNEDAGSLKIIFSFRRLRLFKWVLLSL